MPLFSLFIRCKGVGELVTQSKGSSPYDAMVNFLKTPCLRNLTAKHADWPNDFSMRDNYIFIHLDGLPNAYYCGIGAKGKYVEINIFQTVKRSSPSQRYCGPRRKNVQLR